MTDWNAKHYAQFLDERTRPAKELLALIAHHKANFITDLGCGPANSTELLYKNWSDAHIIGVDSSANMIATAKATLPQVQFIQADFNTWQADIPQDVIFANASLQWADNQRELLPRLVANLTDGGVLAIQMPNNLNEPSHRLMRELANSDTWQGKFKQSTTRPPMLSIHEYYDILTQADCTVDAWQTTYYHVLPSVESIAQWFGSTALRPYMDALGDDDKLTFYQNYVAELSKAYQVQADGKVLMALPRLFMVAIKR
ncbi:MAG: trans-aconitate 2-methyltransferase [Moraxella sp.]|nr:trans-aconitate 2-methyltransferase [Moraxella sp.]